MSWQREENLRAFPEPSCVLGGWSALGLIGKAFQFRSLRCTFSLPRGPGASVADRFSSW
jgi:hypothetical protein